MYQDPQIAWKFTKIRERQEGRYVPREQFIYAYYRARANIYQVEKEFGSIVTINVVFKDFNNDVVRVLNNVSDFLAALPREYEVDELKGELH